MKKIRFIVPVIALCLALTLIVPQTNVAYAASGQVEYEIYGNYSKKIAADRAEVYFSIENLADTEEEAKNLTLEAYEKVNANLQDKLSSTPKINNFSIRANMDYNCRMVIGYTATLNCCFELNDLSNAGELIDIVAKQNVRLNYMNYFSTNAKVEYQQALLEAKNNAIENAKNLASSEIKLIEIKEISQYYAPCEYRSLNNVTNSIDFNAEIEISAIVQLKCETV